MKFYKRDVDHNNFSSKKMEKIHQENTSNNNLVSYINIGQINVKAKSVT